MILSLFADGWAPLREFFVSDSGYAQPREGLGLGWVAGALAVLAAMMPQTAEANPYFCSQLQPGECKWFCTGAECYGSQWVEEEWCKPANGACYREDFQCGPC